MRSVDATTWQVNVLHFGVWFETKECEKKMALLSPHPLIYMPFWPWDRGYGPRPLFLSLASSSRIWPSAELVFAEGSFIWIGWVIVLRHHHSDILITSLEVTESFFVLRFQFHFLFPKSINFLLKSKPIGVPVDDLNYANQIWNPLFFPRSSHLPNLSSHIVTESLPPLNKL